MKFYCLSTSAFLLFVVKINFVLCILNTKYDFSFEGKQGYWTEVFSQEVTPNDGYMNVTMDNTCVVQIERQEIRRLYEEFQEENLSDQDHLLVDVHLSTFAKAANLQNSLIVENFIFIKGRTKSQYRYLPLQLDHFAKIYHLDPTGDLYTDEEFERFKIQVNGKMTDPCLKQVNKHYVTQLGRNTIQVPYTNGISRTFEDTLIAMLTVLRDVSPTLSLRKAFQLRSEVSNKDFFDLTCAGHDPGQSRPGVPYDMSHCCHFRSGNIWTDGAQDKGSNSTDKLLREKRVFHCQKQIGDVYFLRRFSIVMVIIMMLFLPLCVKGFLARPIPYRPLSREQRRFPCDPNDVKKEAEVNGKNTLKQQALGVLQIVATLKLAPPPKEPEEEDEDPDFEYAVGDAANYNYTDVRNRVYVDSDPEFHLDLHLILSYLFLCHIDNHILIVIRRMLFIYGLWLLLGLAASIYLAYYPILLDEPFLLFQGMTINFFMDLFLGKNRSLQTMFYHNLFLLPLAAMIATFLTNMVLLLKKQSIAKSLYSKGEISFFGNRFPNILATARDSRRVPKSSGFKTVERLLFQNLVARIINVFKRDFWRLWWKHWILDKCNPANSNSTREKIAKYCFLLFVWIPFSFVLVVIHVLPMFAIWDSYMQELLRSFLHGADKAGNKFSKSQRIKYLVAFIAQIFGIFIIYSGLWVLLLYYIQFAVFVSIDLTRNAADHIPKLILGFAILAYIKQAFWNFADKYRELKMGAIQAVRDLYWEFREEYYHYNKTVHFVFRTPPHEFMSDFSAYGEVSISRRFFYEVVAIYRPYNIYVVRMFTKLFITIGIISWLIFLIIDFQILDQFNSPGQLLLTMFTVSLPLLIGAVRSPWQRELSLKRRHLNIRGWAERICRLVTEDRFAIPNEEELNDFVDSDTLSPDTDLKLFKKYARRPRSPVQYWSHL